MKYKIYLSMEDCDIPLETVCLQIEADITLKNLTEKINEDFSKYDTADGIAEKYREDYGWGAEGFLMYLSSQHSDWKITTYNFPFDASIKLVGY